VIFLIIYYQIGERLVHFKYYFDVYYLTRKLGMLPFHKNVEWCQSSKERFGLPCHGVLRLIPACLGGTSPRRVVIKIPVIKR